MRPTLQAEMRRLGFRADIETGPNSKRVIIEGDLSAIIESVTAVADLPWKVDANKTRGGGYLTEDGPHLDWTGGNVAQLKTALAGKMDMKPLLEKRAELQKSGLLQKIQTSIRDFVPKRKREMSEHDGEWSSDRKWEITPFSATKRLNAPGRTLDILCHCGVSSFASAEKINRYGALAWSICDIIEQAGITARITMQYGAEGVCSKGDGLVRLIAKEPGNYLAPTVLGAMFQSVFFRRVVFSYFTAAADMLGVETYSSLGRPTSYFNRIRFEEGKLVLSPDVIRASDDEIEREIISAIQNKRKPV